MRLYNTQQPSNVEPSLESMLKSPPEPTRSPPGCLIVHASGAPSCVVYGEVVPAEDEGEAPMLLAMTGESLDLKDFYRCPSHPRINP